MVRKFPITRPHLVSCLASALKSSPGLPSFVELASRSSPNGVLLLKTRTTSPTAHRMRAASECRTFAVHSNEGPRLGNPTRNFRKQPSFGEPRDCRCRFSGPGVHLLSWRRPQSKLPKAALICCVGGRDFRVRFLKQLSICCGKPKSKLSKAALIC